jgi:uncharacterized protein
MDILLQEALPLVLMMLVTGVVGGLLAGLLGVGGGIVIVPMLELALTILDVDPAIRMHVAVATSLAIIIPTSIASTRAHHEKGAVDFALLRSWGVPVLIGSTLGTWIASQVDSNTLAAIFALVALLVAVKMMLPLENKTLASSVPTGLLGATIPLSIGTLSSMMGIGGGTFSVSILTLMSKPIHKAVGTAALFGLLISLPGSVGFIISGWGHPSLPVASLGFVNIIGFALIAPMTVIAAPYGAKMAHALSQRSLSIAFGIFLFLVGIRMLYRAII